MADGAHTRQMSLQDMVQQLKEMNAQQAELKGELKGEIGDMFSEMKADLLGILKQALKLPEQTTVTNPNPSVETVTNPEPLVETLKNSGPFIEPLKRAPVLQVLDSVPEVLIVHRLDSHVEEEEESSPQSTNGNDKIVAHQLFDQMPNEYQKELTVIESSNKEVLSFSHKDARVWEPGGLPTKMDHWDWLKEESKARQKKSHQIETSEVLSSLEPSQFDVTTIADAVWIAKRCESSLLQHLSTTQNRAPFSPYQNYNDQPYYEREFDKCPEIEFDREIPIVSPQILLSQIQVPLSSLEPSPKYLKESLVVVSDMSYDLGCVISKTNGCICDSELGQANSHDEKEFKGSKTDTRIVLCWEKLASFLWFLHGKKLLDAGQKMQSMLVGIVGTEEKLSDRLSLANYVWRPGELLGVQNQWDWISEVHNMGSVLKIMQRFHGLHLQGIISMDMRFREVIVHDLLSVKVCLSVCNRKFEAELEVYLLAHHNSKNQKIACGLICGDVNFHLKHKWRSRLLQTLSRLEFGVLQTGDETQEKRMLFLNNNNKVDHNIKENWFHSEPMIRGVYHLQRPPELIELQGNPNFITKVLVQWKEHPPDHFFSGSQWREFNFSSLRTRMFRRGKYCDRRSLIIGLISWFSYLCFILVMVQTILVW